MFTYSRINEYVTKLTKFRVDIKERTRVTRILDFVKGLTGRVGYDPLFLWDSVAGLYTVSIASATNIDRIFIGSKLS
jgi:hypothetical protein